MNRWRKDTGALGGLVRMVGPFTQRIRPVGRGTTTQVTMCCPTCGTEKRSHVEGNDAMSKRVARETADRWATQWPIKGQSLTGLQA